MIPLVYIYMYIVYTNMMIYDDIIYVSYANIINEDVNMSAETCGIPYSSIA